MSMRRLATALAVPCALIASPAIGQDRGTYGPQDPLRAGAPVKAAPERSNLRLPVMEERERAASISMIESWTVGDNAEVGLGRFRFVDGARPRTNTEREREPLAVDRETRAIAGAGLRIKFD